MTAGKPRIERRMAPKKRVNHLHQMPAHQRAPRLPPRMRAKPRPTKKKIPPYAKRFTKNRHSCSQVKVDVMITIPLMMSNGSKLLVPAASACMLTGKRGNQANDLPLVGRGGWRDEVAMLILSG
jgi:hypothetical protein